jgi:methylmalonyl-CoA/ethylmalonyl-CoA epimerase
MTALSVPAFGEHSAFHHVGVAVRSIADSIGAEAPLVHDAVQRVLVAFVNMNGVRVELIEPADPASPVAAAVERGQPLVHLCFEVADLERALAVGREAGFHKVAAPVPAPAFDGRRIAWVYSRTYGLVELLERER